MARAVNFSEADDNQTVFNFEHAIYLGLTVHEDNGTPAVAAFDVLDGTGARLDTIELAANQSLSLWYGPQGIQARGGIIIDNVAGQFTGSIRVG